MTADKNRNDIIALQKILESCSVLVVKLKINSKNNMVQIVKNDY